MNSLPYSKILIILLFSPFLYSKSVVNVGAYVFQPYFIEDSGSKADGATVDLIRGLNQIQDEYEFVIVKVTPSSRYITFERSRFDMILFESQDWGWSDYSVKSSEVLVESCERFVTKNSEAADQSSFEDIDSKKLVAVMGYHYGFTNMEIDKKKLEDRFNILFVKSNYAALKMLAKGRAEVGVVAAPYLEYFKAEEPEYKDSFLVSDKIDQTYKLSALLRDDHELSVEKLDQLISKLREDGLLSAIIEDWNLNCD